jgi:hypothetical protein
MARVSEWVLGIVGAFASFLGLFVLHAGDDQYLGVFGSWPGRIGDINALLWIRDIAAGDRLARLAGCAAVTLSPRRRPPGPA